MTDEPDYPVGKERPPEHTRWKAGQSGNPKGRPKRAKSAIPHDKVLGRIVTVTMDGVPKEMRADQAFIARLFQQAVSGGVKVAKVVEWYNFGEDVAYEYVSQMAFERADQPKLAGALGIPVESDPEVVLAALAERFSYFFDIQSFADSRQVPYANSTDFNP